MTEDLLNLASELAWAGGERPPSPVRLRRAVSTAYYALFHAVAQLCADELVGRDKPWALVTPIYPSLDHRKARDSIASLRKERTGSTFASISVAFSTLQDARHEADYDPEPFLLNRKGTFHLVDIARQAVLLLEGLSSHEKLALAVKLIARSR